MAGLRACEALVSVTGRLVWATQLRYKASAPQQMLRRACKGQDVVARQGSEDARGDVIARIAAGVRMGVASMAITPPAFCAASALRCCARAFVAFSSSCMLQHQLLRR